MFFLFLSCLNLHGVQVEVFNDPMKNLLFKPITNPPKVSRSEAASLRWVKGNAEIPKNRSWKIKKRLKLPVLGVWKPKDRKSQEGSDYQKSEHCSDSDIILCWTAVFIPNR